MSGKLILTADDYGACEFIDKAVDSVVRHGRINSVAAFVCFDESEKSINNLKSIVAEEKSKGNEVGIGLHFSLTAGYPLSGKDNSISFKNHKNNRICFHAAQNYHFDSVVIKEVIAELELQIQRLANILGGVDNIDHLSNHHGVLYMDDKFYKPFIKTAKKYGIPVRSPQVWSRTRLPYIDYDKKLATPMIREGIALGLWKKFPQLTAKKIKERVQFTADAGLRFPFCVTDTVYGQPDKNNLEFLLGQYENRNMCTEFVFHLGYYEKTPMEAFPENMVYPWGINEEYFISRRKEYSALMELNLEEQLRLWNIQKIPYRQLAMDDWRAIV
ncbi:MAG: ChbG/HpnK family deacetylase [Flavobacteriales bacterium]